MAIETAYIAQFQLRKDVGGILGNNKRGRDYAANTSKNKRQSGMDWEYGGLMRTEGPGKESGEAAHGGLGRLGNDTSNPQNLGPLMVSHRPIFSALDRRNEAMAPKKMLGQEELGGLGVESSFGRYWQKSAIY